MLGPARQIAAALVLAEMTFEAVLSGTAGRAHNDLGWITDIHAKVHQASGMVKYDFGIANCSWKKNDLRAARQR